MFEFTYDEKNRLMEIMDELKDLFMADSVGLTLNDEHRSYSGKDDYKIIIYKSRKKFFI